MVNVPTSNLLYRMSNNGKLLQHLLNHFHVVIIKNLFITAHFHFIYPVSLYECIQILQCLYFLLLSTHLHSDVLSTRTFILTNRSLLPVMSGPSHLHHSYHHPWFWTNQSQWFWFLHMLCHSPTRYCLKNKEYTLVCGRGCQFPCNITIILWNEMTKGISCKACLPGLRS